MPVSPNFKPVNQLRWRYDPINELQISGGEITTERSIAGGYQISGSAVTSRNVCKGYEISISYDGPVDIGDRRILSNRILNPRHDGNIVNQAKRETGIEKGYTAWHGFLTCLGVITCTYCCCINCIGEDVNKRDKTLSDKIDALADEKISKIISDMLRQADEMVSARIKEKRDSAPPASAGAGAGAGTITLTAEQFQLLLAGRAALPSAPPAQVPAVVLGPSAVTVQFDKAKSREERDLRKAKAKENRADKTKSQPDKLDKPDKAAEIEARAAAARQARS